jgi:deoxyinosine 3'endonuclease (endonuclease V)
LDLGGVRHVAGADVSTQGDRAYATVVVLEFPSLSPVEVQGFEAALEFPYVPVYCRSERYLRSRAPWRRSRRRWTP